MKNNLLNIALNDRKPGQWAPAMIEPEPLPVQESISMRNDNVPGANAWFNRGGKVFGHQLSGRTQNILGTLGEIAALSPGRAINVTGKATSLLDDIIARNKQSVKNITKGPTPKELDEARRIIPEELSLSQHYIMFKDKMHRVPDEFVDDFQIENTLNKLREKMFGIPKNRVLNDLRLDKATMTKDEILQYINRSRGPKLTYPMGGKEEIARKAGLLTRKDIDYEQIPTFIRNKLK